MIRRPVEGERLLRFVGMDPGSHFFGAATIDVDMVTGETTVVDATTFVTERALKITQRDDLLIHGDRYARLFVLREELAHYLSRERPHIVVSESAFLGAGINAYMTLIECVGVIREVLYVYNPNVELLTRSPKEVKQGVKAAGDDKEDVTQALLALPNLKIPDYINFHTLTDHARDAIAVAYGESRKWVPHIRT
jgi:Holliday junction resolvasome RuvABC endonuclease subunit